MERKRKEEICENPTLYPLRAVWEAGCMPRFFHIAQCECGATVRLEADFSDIDDDDDGWPGGGWPVFECNRSEEPLKVERDGEVRETDPSKDERGSGNPQCPFCGEYIPTEWERLETEWTYDHEERGA